MTDADVQRNPQQSAARPSRIEPHQIRAAGSPRLPLKVLAAGNFHDLDMLLDQMGEAPLFELGKPLPNDRYVPRARIGNCPAAHNRALFGRDD